MRTPKAQLPLKLPPELVERFRSRCRDTGRTQSGTVKVLIQKWLNGEIKL